MERDIITVDKDKCTGCGICVDGCPEGALQIVDGKACLVGELLCDGLGACIGECPEELVPDRYIQMPEEILNCDKYLSENNKNMSKVLSKILSGKGWN